MSSESSRGQPAGAAAPLGVLDAMSLGWRLVASDFWRLWLVALVVMLISMAAGFFGLPAGILVGPPLAAGLFYVVGRRIDGGPARVGDLFAGFKERFGESVIGYLPVSLGSVVLGAMFGIGMWLLVMIGAAAIAAAEGEEAVVATTVVAGVLVFLLVEMCLLVAMGLLYLFFVFVPAAVWDHKGSGWQAARASMRLVWDHIVSMLGFLVLFWLIGAAANLVGMLACCVGWVFTTPAVTVWSCATLLYLYRSWTGRETAPVPPGDETAMTKTEG